MTVKHIGSALMSALGRKRDLGLYDIFYFGFQAFKLEVRSSGPGKFFPFTREMRVRPLVLQPSLFHSLYVCKPRIVRQW